MSLQDIFYLVSIITLSLIAILLLALVIVAFYIRSKIGELSQNVGEVIKQTKNVVSNPKQLAANIGEAVFDTAVDQVEKFIKPKTKNRSTR